MTESALSRRPRLSWSRKQLNWFAASLSFQMAKNFQPRILPRSSENNTRRLPGNSIIRYNFWLFCISLEVIRSVGISRVLSATDSPRFPCRPTAQIQIPKGIWHLHDEFSSRKASGGNQYPPRIVRRKKDSTEDLDSNIAFSNQNWSPLNWALVQRTRHGFRIHVLYWIHSEKRIIPGMAHTQSTWSSFEGSRLGESPKAPLDISPFIFDISGIISIFELLSNTSPCLRLTRTMLK